LVTRLKLYFSGSTSLTAFLPLPLNLAPVWSLTPEAATRLAVSPPKRSAYGSALDSTAWRLPDTSAAAPAGILKLRVTAVAGSLPDAMGPVSEGDTFFSLRLWSCTQRVVLRSGIWG
jgi:hypothetical protein